MPLISEIWAVDLWHKRIIPAPKIGFLVRKRNSPRWPTQMKNIKHNHENIFFFTKKSNDIGKYYPVIDLGQLSRDVIVVAQCRRYCSTRNNSMANGYPLSVYLLKLLTESLNSISASDGVLSSLPSLTWLDPLSQLLLVGNSYPPLASASARK